MPTVRRERIPDGHTLYKHHGGREAQPSISKSFVEYWPSSMKDLDVHCAHKNVGRSTNLQSILKPGRRILH
jgi:hypothetical protein